MSEEAVDLSEFIPLDEAVIEIKRNGNPTGWKITLAGPAHPKTQTWATENSRRNIRRQQMMEQAQANGKKYKAEDRSVEDVRQENLGWVVSRIVNWTPVKIGAETFPFSDENAIRLLARPTMGWAFNQIVEALDEERSFTKRSGDD